MTAFLTGFPGFLGSALTRRLVERGESVTCLVQPAYGSLASERANAILRTVDGPAAGDVDLVTGDITEPELGMAGDPVAVRDSVQEVYHLAAVYDLGVDRETAREVNVRGTERVLDFADDAGADRIHYVSTCYVSGRHDGVFGPEDLDVGKSFANHYEASKFAAEVAVQERMAEGLPATIYRPSIVTGDSETGATEKYDGLYYLLRLIERQPGIAVVPVQPPSRRYEFNVVPRDFVVDAIAHLSGRPETVGSVYQLCDPSPPTVHELLARCGAATNTRVLRLPVHAGALGRILQAVPGLAERVDVEPASLPYLSNPTSYVAPNTRRALAGTGIAPPALSSYLEQLLAYLRSNPQERSAAMV